MKITLQYFDGCPNWKITDQNLQALIGQMGLGAEIEYRLVETPEAAEEHDFRGSPTVRINGVDPFAQEDAPVGLSCRIHVTDDGPAGSPSREQLAKALEAAV